MPIVQTGSITTSSGQVISSGGGGSSSGGGGGGGGSSSSSTSSLTSGFNAQGQAVVKNAFGGWSPVINGVVQNQSTTGPVSSGSVYVNPNGGGGGGSSYSSNFNNLARQGLISTPYNKAQVQNNFQAQRDLAVKNAVQNQAYQKFINEVNSIRQTASQGSIASLVNLAHQKAQDYYQKSMESYFSNPSNLVRSGNAPMSRAPNIGPGQGTDNFPIINSFIRGLPANSVLKKVINTIYNKIDLYSGGGLNAPKLDRLQEDLNKKVDSYQMNYASKSFANQADYNKANQLYLELTTSQAAIDAARQQGQQGLNDVFRGARNPNLSALAVKLGLTSPLKKSAEVGVASALANAGVGLIQLPSGIVSLLKSPRAILSIPSGMVTSIKDSITTDKNIIMLNPVAGIARVATQLGIQYATFKLTDAGIKPIGTLKTNIGARLSKYFRKTETTGLGTRYIKDVPGVGNIELIRGEGQRLKVNPIKGVRESNIGIELSGNDILPKQLRSNPKLPSSTNVEKRILNIVRDKGDTISGSFSQETFLKKQFTTAHKDLDILTKDRSALMKSLKNEFGNNIRFNPLKTSIQVSYKGKVIADLVEYAKGEAGYVKKYGTRKVQGLNVVNPEARLASKIYQLGIGKAKYEPKVLRDIKNLYGRNEIAKGLERPAAKGAYGYSAREQSKYVGKRVTLTSSQADLLVRKILKSNKELKLEKWFYATPEDLKSGIAQVRSTRLGLTGGQEASLMDLLSGKASLSKGKPQIFVLPKEKIFSAGETLSKSKFVITKGFVVPNFSDELEVILGKGYIIRRGKKLATTIIDGDKVEIYQLEKIKIPKTLKGELNSLKKLNEKVLSKKELSSGKKSNLLNEIASKEKQLNAKIKRATNIDYFSERTFGKKQYPIIRKGSSGILSSLPSQSVKVLSKKINYTSSGQPYVKTSIGSRFVSPSKVSRGKYTGGSTITSSVRSPTSFSPPSRPSPSYPRSPIRTSRPPSSPPRYTPSYHPPKSPTGFRLQTSSERKQSHSKAIPSFNVYGKVGRKFIKLNKGVLSRQDALNKGTYAIDNTVAKTFKIVPAGRRKTVYSVPNIEKNYYQRAGYKLREYKISRGKKFGILPKYIERRPFGIDTRGEKKGLSIQRYIKGFGKGGRGYAVKRARRISAAQRKVMLKNLRKARRVLARKR